MRDLRKRLITGILGAVLTFAVVACSDDSSPTDTTPGQSDTPKQVGS